MSVPADHERWEDAAAAYVLEALPASDQRDFEIHLESCPVCREEMQELRMAADALALAAPPMPAPPELRSRVMAVVEREAELLRAAGPEADRPARSRRRPKWRSVVAGAWLRPVFAVPLILALLVLGGVVGLVAGGGFDDDGVRTVRAQVDPDLAPGAQVRLEVGSRGATLVAERLPAPPEGRVYQVWVKRPDADPEPTSTLFLPRRDGSAAAAVPGSLEGTEAVLVSHEPPGGSPSPTSPPILSVEPPA
jgi:anti-sigma-K factor RskA